VFAYADRRQAGLKGCLLLVAAQLVGAASPLPLCVELPPPSFWPSIPFGSL